jgi:hypothetical protein
LKKMIAVREAERADARANIARLGLEAAIAERAAEDPVAGPGTEPETESGESASDAHTCTRYASYSRTVTARPNANPAW